MAALGGRSLSGRLEAQASLNGTADGLTGQGRAQIRDGRLHDLPVLGAVAAALDLPHLRDLRFQEGAIDFTLAGDVLRTPVVRFISGDVRILGKGEVQLRTGELAHQFTLLVPQAAVRRAPKRDAHGVHGPRRRPGGRGLPRLGPVPVSPHRSPGPRPPRVRGVDPSEGAQAVPAIAPAARAGCPGLHPSAIVAPIMARGRVFYGWWVTIAFAVMVLLSTGVRFAVGPFLKPMVADLGTDRAAYSLVVSLSLLLYGVFMPFVGQLVERWGARPVAVAGILVFATSLAGTGLVTNLWQLAIVYGVLVALGLSATGHVVGSAVVSRWFIRRRATALSVLGAASMAGMSLLVPLAMWLILLVGWRATYALIGLGSGHRPAPSGALGCPGVSGIDGARARRACPPARSGRTWRRSSTRPCWRRCGPCPSGSSAAACTPADSR